MNIFVGNLSFEAKEIDVHNLFIGFGAITSVVIVKDKKGRESRGFCFIEMPDDREADAAIKALDGKEFMGRPLNVGIVRPKTVGERKIQQRKKLEAKNNIISQARYKEEQVKKKEWVEQGLARKKGGYKGGRRSRRFIYRVAGEAYCQANILQKDGGLPKPQKKNEEEPKPWLKNNRPLKPWLKNTKSFKK